MPVGRPRRLHRIVLNQHALVTRFEIDDPQCAGPGVPSGGYVVTERAESSEGVLGVSEWAFSADLGVRGIYPAGRHLRQFY